MADFLGIRARAGAANYRIHRLKPSVAPEKIRVRCWHVSWIWEILDRHSRRLSARRWALPINQYFLPIDDAELRRRARPSEPGL